MQQNRTRKPTFRLGSSLTWERSNRDKNVNRGEKVGQRAFFINTVLVRNIFSKFSSVESMHERVLSKK